MGLQRRALTSASTKDVLIGMRLRLLALILLFCVLGLALRPSAGELTINSIVIFLSASALEFLMASIFIHMLLIISRQLMRRPWLLAVYLGTILDYRCISILRTAALLQMVVNLELHLELRLFVIRFLLQDINLASMQI